MKNSIIILLITALSTLCMCFSSCNYSIVAEREIVIACEYAYFEGQKDAIKGDIRIAVDSSSLNGYKWTKSPWDDGDLPLYNPNEALREQCTFCK